MASASEKDRRTDDIIAQVTKDSRSLGTQRGAGGEEIPAGVSRQTPEQPRDSHCTPGSGAWLGRAGRIRGSGWGREAGLTEAQSTKGLQNSCGASLAELRPWFCGTLGVS